MREGFLGMLRLQGDMKRKGVSFAALLPTNLPLVFMVPLQRLFFCSRLTVLRLEL